MYINEKCMYAYRWSEPVTLFISNTVTLEAGKPWTVQWLRYQLDEKCIVIWLPSRKICPSYPRLKDRHWAQAPSYSVGSGESFPGLGQPELETNHST